MERIAAFGQSLDRVFEQCAADESCRRAYPDLEAEFHAWIDRLDRDPVELEMADTDRFPEGRMVVDGSLALGAVFQGLYNQRFPPIVPLLVQEGDPESRDVWRALADQLADSAEKASQGLQLSVNCYEVAPFNPPALLDRARREYPRLGKPLENRDRHAECAAWHDERADSSYFEPVRSELPAFIANGEFDPVTPPEFGKLVAEKLPNSTLIEAPAHGHGVIPLTNCTRKLTNQFLEDPGRSLDTGCVAELPSLSFVTDVHVSRGIYPIARTIQQGPDTPMLAGVGFAGVVFLTGLIGWPIGAAVRRKKGEPALPVSGMHRAARPIAALAALLVLGFVVLLLFAIRDAASTNPLLLAFGISGEFGWLFFLPWIVAALSVVVVVAAVRSWRTRWWHLGHRIHYSLIAIACVVFVAYSGWQGFM